MKFFSNLFPRKAQPTYQIPSLNSYDPSAIQKNFPSGFTLELFENSQPIKNSRYVLNSQGILIPQSLIMDELTSQIDYQDIEEATSRVQCLGTLPEETAETLDELIVESINSLPEEIERNHKEATDLLNKYGTNPFENPTLPLGILYTLGTAITNETIGLYFSRWSLVENK